MTVHDRPTMTVTHAATVLGISRTTAYECIRRGQIPSFRLGGRIIVPTQAIEQLLTTGARHGTETSEQAPVDEQDTLF